VVEATRKDAPKVKMRGRKKKKINKPNQNRGKTRKEEEG